MKKLPLLTQSAAPARQQPKEWILQTCFPCGQTRVHYRLTTSGEWGCKQCRWASFSTPQPTPHAEAQPAIPTPQQTPEWTLRSCFPCGQKRVHLRQTKNDEWKCERCVRRTTPTITDRIRENQNHTQLSDLPITNSPSKLPSRSKKKVTPMEIKIRLRDHLQENQLSKKQKKQEVADINQVIQTCALSLNSSPPTNISRTANDILLTSKGLLHPHYSDLERFKDYYVVFNQNFHLNFIFQGKEPVHVPDRGTPTSLAFQVARGTRRRPRITNDTAPLSEYKNNVLKFKCQYIINKGRVKDYKYNIKVINCFTDKVLFVRLNVPITKTLTIGLNFKTLGILKYSITLKVPRNLV